MKKINIVQLLPVAASLGLLVAAWILTPERENGVELNAAYLYSQGLDQTVTAGKKYGPVTSYDQWEWIVRYKPHQQSVRFRMEGKTVVKDNGNAIESLPCKLGLCRDNISPHCIGYATIDGVSNRSVDGFHSQNTRIFGLPVACLETKGKRYLITMDAALEIFPAACRVPELNIYRIDNGKDLVFLGGEDGEESRMKLHYTAEAAESALEAARVLADIEFDDALQNTIALYTCVNLYSKAMHKLRDQYTYRMRCREEGTEADKAYARRVLEIQKEALGYVVRRLTQDGVSLLPSRAEFCKQLHDLPEDVYPVPDTESCHIYDLWETPDTEREFYVKNNITTLAEKQELTRPLLEVWQKAVREMEPGRASGPDLESTRYIRTWQRFLQLKTEQEWLEFAE